MRISDSHIFALTIFSSIYMIQERLTVIKGKSYPSQGTMGYKCYDIDSVFVFVAESGGGKGGGGGGV